VFTARYGTDNICHDQILVSLIPLKLNLERVIFWIDILESKEFANNNPLNASRMSLFRLRNCNKFGFNILSNWIAWAILIRRYLTKHRILLNLITEPAFRPTCFVVFVLLWCFCVSRFTYILLVYIFFCFSYNFLLLSIMTFLATVFVSYENMHMI